MKKLLIEISFLFRPFFWIMLYRYNKRWDDLISYIIDNRVKPISVDDHTIKVCLNGKTFEVWISNYPHAYGRSESPVKVRPSRYNIVRLQNYLNDCVISEYFNMK